MGEFKDEISSGDQRRALVALRDLLANELEVHRCDRCTALQLRTGDTAALALRLQKVLEDIQTLPPENAEGKVTRLAAIRGRRDAGPSGASEAEGSVAAQLGYKSSPRRQGGRAASGTRKPGA